jgi:adenylate cyclase
MWPWSEIRLLRNALRLFAGEHILDRVTNERERALVLGGDRREITLMFVDINIDFALVKEPNENQMVELIYAYYEAVTNCIGSHSGTIDTIIGDSFAAWWAGADQTGNAKSACLCAKAIVAQIARLNSDTSDSCPKLKIKVGVNSGVVTLGNYGTYKRMRYAALGDNVNLTSNLCAIANANYPTPIVISAATSQLLGGQIPSTLLGSVQVKGRNEPVQLYAL